MHAGHCQRMEKAALLIVGRSLPSIPTLGTHVRQDNVSFSKGRSYLLLETW